MPCFWSGAGAKHRARCFLPAFWKLAFGAIRAIGARRSFRASQSTNPGGADFGGAKSVGPIEHYNGNASALSRRCRCVCERTISASATIGGSDARGWGAGARVEAEEVSRLYRGSHIKFQLYCCAPMKIQVAPRWGVWVYCAVCTKFQLYRGALVKFRVYCASCTKFHMPLGSRTIDSESLLAPPPPSYRVARSGGVFAVKREVGREVQLRNLWANCVECSGFFGGCLFLIPNKYYYSIIVRLYWL